MKPENLLLDAHGYLKLVDFGLAKKVQDRTFTLCGTPEYIAPEIISNQGHAVAVDWWAFGILIFEMLVGTPPFVDDDPMRLYGQILHGQIKFPEEPKLTANAQSLLSKLLDLNPMARLGSFKKGSKDIVAHPFFAMLDIGDLPNRTLTAPFIPELKSDRDITHFGEVSEVDPASQNPIWMTPLTKDEEQLFAGL